MCSLSDPIGQHIPACQVTICSAIRDFSSCCSPVKEILCCNNNLIVVLPFAHELTLQGANGNWVPAGHMILNGLKPNGCSCSDSQKIPLFCLILLWTASWQSFAHWNFNGLLATVSHVSLKGVAHCLTMSFCHSLFLA